MALQFFDRFKTVGFKISSASGFLILLSVLSGYLFYQNSISYRFDAETVTNVALRNIDIFETDVLIYKMVRAEKDYVLTGQDEFKNQRISFSNLVDEELDFLITTSVTETSRANLLSLKERKVEYDRNFVTAVSIFESGVEDAFLQVEELSLINTDILLDAESNLISEIVSEDVALIEATLKEAQDNSTFARNVALLVMGIALTLGVIVSFFVIRSTTIPLRNILERLVSLADVLGDSVAQATEVADQNATNATQLASSATQLSKQVEEITTTISQTASAISGVAKLSQEGTTSAQRVNELSQKGGEGAEKASASLESISKIVTNAVTEIESLAGRSKEVGTLAGEVTNIADQTNILALNAAIEAARAGEAGRGFAVVADEVRRLAESSGNFSDQITKLITSVVDQAQKTSEGTQEGAEEIKESTNIINTSLASFREISSAVASTNEKISQISSNISQQAQAAEQISKTTTSISQGIEQTSTSARTFAEAVDRQKVVISVIEKSLEEAQSILSESGIMVGLEVDSRISTSPKVEESKSPKTMNDDNNAKDESINPQNEKDKSNSNQLPDARKIKVIDEENQHAQSEDSAER